jgi:hypothetical protein
VTVAGFSKSKHFVSSLGLTFLVSKKSIKKGKLIILQSQFVMSTSVCLTEKLLESLLH